MSVAFHPGSRLTRADLWLGLRWFPLMLAAIWTLFLVYGWAEKGGGFTASWTVAAPASSFANLANIWTLSLAAALLVVATRKGAYLLVLGLCSMAFFIRCAPVFSLYFLFVASILYPILHFGGKWKSPVFWFLLMVFTVILPKWAYAWSLHSDGSGGWHWINDVILTGLLIRYAWIFFEQRRGKWERPGFFEHLSYLAFIPQITATLNFGPADQWRKKAHYPGVYWKGWQALAMGAGKILLFKWLSPVAPDVWADDAGLLQIWSGMIFLYLNWFLWLSGHFDLAVAFCRFLGASIPNNFRFPLLAPTFLEHWRRWNIFNRKLLIQLVYRPLGGFRKQAGRNLAAVFVASALVLHGGWFGSKYWTIQPDILVGWILFAAAQGGLIWWGLRRFRQDGNRGLETREQRRGLSWLRGWLVTQLTMAWLHLLILGTGSMPGDPTIPLFDRLQSMCKAFGIGL